MARSNSRKGIFRSLWRLMTFFHSLARAATLAVGGWVAYSRVFVPHQLTLTHALGGERRTFSWNGLQLSYYVTGAGKPLVLLHGVNVAASSYEVKPLYDHLAASHRVYALDLPGFGFSERRKLEYSPRFFAGAIQAFLRSEVLPEGGPADVVALSLSAGFAARAACDAPELFRSLVMISPTGPGRQTRLHGNDTLLRLLSVPLWSRALYDLLTTRQALTFFFRRVFLSRRPPENLIAYAYLTAHQPGAHHAPMYFLSGKLSSPDIKEVYDCLNLPVMVLYGRGSFAGFRKWSEYEKRPNWFVVRVEGAGEMPHFEQPEVVADALSKFLSDYALAKE